MIMCYFAFVYYIKSKYKNTLTSRLEGIKKKNNGLSYLFSPGTDTASQQEFTSCLKETLRGLAKNADNLQVSGVRENK